MSVADEYATWIEEDILAYSTTNTWGVVTPRITGSISVVSSALIIHVILRSSTRLSSTHHRIVMGMSMCDILGSAAIALTTLPFPKDDKWVDLYNYNGTRLGTYSTCAAQGFFQFYGSLGAYFYNMNLCVYYACTVALSMQAKKIARFVEPWMHLITIVVSVWVSLDVLLNGGYNPAPRGTSWCTMTPLPYSCLEPLLSPPCERGSKKNHHYMESIIRFISGGLLVIMFISLSMVCVKVTKLYLGVRKSRRGHGRITEQQKANLDSHFCCMRATFIQAISYMLALLITILPSLFVMLTPLPDSMLNYMPALTLPLQGLFNLAIFVGAKVYHLRRADSEVSLIKALREIMLKTSFEDDAEALVFTGMRSNMGARDSMPSSVTSSKPPSCYSRPTEEGKDSFNDEFLSTDQSRDISDSKSAWDDISWKSQSTKCLSGKVSELGLCLPDGLSEAPSGKDLSHDLSPRLSEAPSEDLSQDLSLSTRQS